MDCTACGVHWVCSAWGAAADALLPPLFLSICPAAIIRLLYDLHKQALAVGGAVYMLNGNHESLNVCGDFR